MTKQEIVKEIARKMDAEAELMYNISRVWFTAGNSRGIAAWTPGTSRPSYTYKVRTSGEYDRAMERIRREAERFRRHVLYLL